MLPRSVLFIIPYLGGGGAERVIVNLANVMQAEGVRVGILTLHANGSYEGDLSSGVDLQNTGPWIRSIPGRIRITRKILKLSQDYEVIISALEMFTDRVVHYCRLIHKIRGIRKVYVGMVHIALSGYASYKRRKTNAWRVRRIYPRFDAVIAVSNGVKQDLLDIYRGKPDNVVVIYNPLDLDRIRKAAAEPVEGIAEYQPYFINIGRLVDAKDQRTLIQAFAQFSEAQKGYHLLILGQGPNEEKLRVLAKELALDNLHFIGFQANPWRYLRHAVALVQTSILEGFPLVLGEALACGTPVISTDCEYGPDELLESGHNGYLVPCRDVDRIVRAMQEVLANPEEAKARTADAARMLTRLDLPNVVTEYSRSFDRLIEARGLNKDDSSVRKAR